MAAADARGHRCRGRSGEVAARAGGRRSRLCVSRRARESREGAAVAAAEAAGATGAPIPPAASLLRSHARHVRPDLAIAIHSYFPPSRPSSSPATLPHQTRCQQKRKRDSLSLLAFFGIVSGRADSSLQPRECPLLSNLLSWILFSPLLEWHRLTYQLEDDTQAGPASKGEWSVRGDIPVRRAIGGL